MNKKQTYTSPEVQVFVVQIEDCVLTVPSPAVGANGLQGSNVITGGSAGFYGWDD